MMNGEIVELSSSELSSIKRSYKSFASEGNRMIAFALLQLDREKFPEDYEFCPGDKLELQLDRFVYLGFVALNCTIRDEASQFVERMRENHLRLIVL